MTGCALVQPTLFPLAAERGSWRRLLSSAPVPAGPSHWPVPAPHQGVTLTHRKPHPCAPVCDTWCLFCGEGVEGYDGERSGWGGMRGGGEAVTRRVSAGQQQGSDQPGWGAPSRQLCFALQRATAALSPPLIRTEVQQWP